MTPTRDLKKEIKNQRDASMELLEMQEKTEDRIEALEDRVLQLEEEIVNMAEQNNELRVYNNQLTMELNRVIDFLNGEYNKTV